MASIFKQEDDHLRNLLDTQRPLYHTHRARCSTVCENLIAVLRNDLASLHDLDSCSKWTLTRHALTYSSGPQPDRPGPATGQQQNLPDCELVMYFSLEKPVFYYDDYKDLSGDIRKALLGISDFCQIEDVTDKVTGFSHYKVKSSAAELVIIVKFALEMTPNPKLSFVSSTWVTTLGLLHNVEEYFEEINDLTSVKRQLLATFARGGAAKIAEYLREQPPFVRDVVILAKLWMVQNVTAEKAVEDQYISSLMELMAITRAKVEMDRAERYKTSASLTRALVEVLKWLCVDGSIDYFIFGDFLTWPKRDARKEELRRKYGLPRDPLLNPHLSIFWDEDAKSAWRRLHLAAMEAVERAKKFQWRRVDASMAERNRRAELYLENLMSNYNKVGFDSDADIIGEVKAEFREEAGSETNFKNIGRVERAHSYNYLNELERNCYQWLYIIAGICIVFAFYMI